MGPITAIMARRCGLHRACWFPAQIAEQVEALGSGIGVRSAVLVGGIDMMAQAIALAKRPHVIVGTPGRVVDHLSNTKVWPWLGTDRKQSL